MNYKIRLETQEDYQAVEELTREAFWNLYKPGCDEHYLVNVMRNHPDCIGDLNYVVEADGKIVGSIIYTKSKVMNELGEKIDTVTFGPLCVHPLYQRAGLGTRLIGHTKEKVMERGYPAIIIFGDPHNYCKHDFKNGKDVNICTAGGKQPLGLLVLELEPGAFREHKWEFKESEVYMIDQSKVDEFDWKFPEKEKRHMYSQDLFSMLVRSVVE